MPLLVDHPLQIQWLGLYQLIQIGVGPLDLVVVVVVVDAWPIMVGPLGQKERIGHRWQAPWMPMGGRRLIVVVVALAVVVVEVAVLEPLGLLDVLASM